MGGMDMGHPAPDRASKIGEPAHKVPTKPYWQEDVTPDNDSWSWWELLPWQLWLCIIFMVAGAIWLVTV